MLNLTCRTISVCELLHICDQSVYLNHSNKDCNWLVVACFMRVNSKLTTLLFALEILWKLNVMPGEFNEFFTIKQMECFDSRSREKHSTTISVSPCSSFVLQLLSTCFTTEQSTVEASLCICSRNSSRHNLIKKIVDGPTCFPGYENHKQQESWR